MLNFRNIVDRISVARMKRTNLDLANSPSVESEASYVPVYCQEAGSMEPNVPEAYRYFNPQRMRRSLENIGELASVVSSGADGPSRTMSAQEYEPELTSGDPRGIQQARRRLQSGFGAAPISPQLRRAPRIYSGPLGILHFSQGSLLGQISDLSRVPVKTLSYQLARLRR